MYAFLCQYVFLFYLVIYDIYTNQQNLFEMVLTMSCKTYLFVHVRTNKNIYLWTDFFARVKSQLPSTYQRTMKLMMQLSQWLHYWHRMVVGQWPADVGNICTSFTKNMTCTYVRPDKQAQEGITRDNWVSAVDGAMFRTNTDMA